MSSDEEFYAEIREFFLLEASDLLESTESCFLDLEKNPHDKEIIQSIFRLVHNIKGSAKSVGLNSLAEFAHQVENVLAKIRADELPLNDDVISLLLKANDRIRENVEALKEDSNNQLDNSDLTAEIEALLSGKVKSSSVSPPSKAPEKSLGEILVEDAGVALEDVEKAVKYQESKIGEILVDQGKVSPEKLEESVNKQIKVNRKKPEEYIRIALSKIDEMVNYFGEQVILQSTLEYAKEDLVKNRELIQKTITQLSKITYDLQQTTISLRMVSVKTLFAKLERAVRDSAKMVGKEVVFHKSGEEFELDKNILESIIDPLTHMVRNAVDHGLESPDERERVGKDRVGNVWLNIYPRGGYFYIEVKDDGKGLDREKILQKALDKGIISHPNLSDQEIYNLIFRSGFSTKEKTTELSGRGVGMDVVKTSIEALKGTCYIDSTPGAGSCFTIRLPQTLAIFNGIVFEVGGHNYVVANSDVIEIVPYVEELVRYVEGGAITDVKGEVIEVVDLEKILRAPKEKKCEEFKEPSMLIVNYKGKKYGLKVDRLVMQQRIVHKPVGYEVKKVQGVTGGTILGDGQVALILSPSEVLSVVH